VSFHTVRIERCCKYILSTFLATNFGKREQFSIVLKENNLLSLNGRLYTLKLMLFRLLVLVVRDLVITLSAIAYNVNSNLDEVLLAIVCTVYSRNVITRSP